MHFSGHCNMLVKGGLRTVIALLDVIFASVLAALAIHLVSTSSSK